MPFWQVWINRSGKQGLQVQGDVIQRKVAAARLSPVEVPAQGVPRLWPLALARATRDSLALGLEAISVVTSHMSLTELLDVVPERSLIAVLDGPKDGLGVMILSPPVLSALIEVQTLGQVVPGPAQTRKPTRTDAAMVAGWIDTALHGLEVLLAYDADMPWADGFRYASHLDDARPLSLLLEDVPYRLVTVEVSLAMGLKTGPVLLALPAYGRGRPPKVLAPEAVAPPLGPIFAEEMEARIMAAECTLQAVIARLRMPLSQVLDLGEGAILPLAEAGIDRVLLESADGRPLAEGKLGQHRGHRAIRLTAIVEPETRQNVDHVPLFSQEGSVSALSSSEPTDRILRAG